MVDASHSAVSYQRLLPVALLPVLFTAGCAIAADAGEDATTAEAQLRERTPTITFTSSFDEFASSRLERGQTVRIAYDLERLPQCRGEQNGIPQWSVGGSWRIGDGPVRTFTVGGLNAASEAPAITVDRAGDLQLWFESGDRWGCHAYDSNFGANYHFAVAPAATDPGWIGNARWALDRQTCDGGPCEASLQPLGEAPVVYDTWVRERAAIRVVQFDVWKERVTDRDNPDLWKELDVQLHSRVAGTQDFTTRYVDFDHRVGNDARYGIDLRSLDALSFPGVVPARADCPSYPLTRIAGSGGDDLVEVPVEFYVTVNGVELRPASGKTFQIRYRNHASLVAVCLDR